MKIFSFSPVMEETKHQIYGLNETGDRILFATLDPEVFKEDPAKAELEAQVTMTAYAASLPEQQTLFTLVQEEPRLDEEVPFA